ncbi:MAG: hypothetical protein KUG50_00965 [Cycloclasticus sp.]|nr:hypothetical protein [Cycloclasticus sp.]
MTSPCPTNPWSVKESYVIEGLTSGGRGKIKHADVSIDAGITWRSTRLKHLVLIKALTRFPLPLKSNGSLGLLKSRAIDETSYVQPTITQLRQARGENSIYHIFFRIQKLKK